MSQPLPLPLGDQLLVARILDANANRASEGLRVVEEYARFVLADRYLATELKSVRHALQAALQQLPSATRFAARDTAHDVGTQIGTPAEYERTSAADVAAANLARIQQALRALEEFGKTDWPELARQVEPLRYRLYVLGQVTFRSGQAQERMAEALLYVIVNGGRDAVDFAGRCRAVLAGGAHVLQLRDKQLDDRTLLIRARALREWTSVAGATLIINDRPDLARLARADGVHVGQDELRVHEARTIVGSEALVGVSTHSIAQARQAVLEGADYLGCGPAFASTTKSFAQFPGLEFLRQVADEIGLPAFAIGGIRLDNLPDVLRTGIRRVAVSQSVWNADDPEQAARLMRDHLRAAERR